MSFDEHLKKAIEGDPDSIEYICSTTWEPLYRFIYYRVQNREEAEDITQESYVRALNHMRVHKAIQENFVGFIKTVALNILRDRWRHKKRWGTPISVESVNPSETAGPDHQVIVTQRLYIENSLAKLSETHRRVIELRIIKGYSVAETAKIIEKTESAVRTSQYRALQALAEIMEEHDKEG